MSSTRPSGWGFSPDSPLSCTDISTDFSFYWGFPDSSVGQESTCNAGDPGSIPGLGRSPGEGIGYPFQYSCASLASQLVRNPPAMWETWVRSLGWEDPLEERAWQPTPVFLPGESPWTEERLHVAMASLVAQW